MPNAKIILTFSDYSLRMKTPPRPTLSAPTALQNSGLRRIVGCLRRAPSHLLIYPLMVIFVAYDGFRDRQDRITALDTAVQPPAEVLGSGPWHLGMLLLIGLSGYRAIHHCLRSRSEIKQHEQSRIAREFELDSLKRQLKLAEVRRQIRRLSDHLLGAKPQPPVAQFVTESSQPPQPSQRTRIQSEKVSTSGKLSRESPTRSIRRWGSP